MQKLAAPFKAMGLGGSSSKTPLSSEAGPVVLVPEGGEGDDYGHGRGGAGGMASGQAGDAGEASSAAAAAAAASLANDENAILAMQADMPLWAVGELSHPAEEGAAAAAGGGGKSGGGLAGVFAAAFGGRSASGAGGGAGSAAGSSKQPIGRAPATRLGVNAASNDIYAEFGDGNPMLL